MVKYNAFIRELHISGVQQYRAVELSELKIRLENILIQRKERYELISVGMSV